MNKRNIILASIILGVSLSIFSIVKFENTAKAGVYQDQSGNTVISDNISTYSVQAPPAETTAQTQQTNESNTNDEISVAVSDTQKSTADTTSNVPLSRGGTPSPKKLEEAKKMAQAAEAETKAKAEAKAKAETEAKAIAEKESKVELLDWWDSARYVFSRGTTAVVTDVYTGKSFKVQRTMGTNHADTEALTKEDTAIIKSIWGGFSWERRPVIVTVDGRKLAASMSAMPHAGVDSEPAYEYVNNRSNGYGSGENLDVIKGNDMDGHFDIHFLNSTRHMDGDKDPQHQTAIKVAAGK
ncbi:hypothetical protein [Clostridium thermarum]|uniref:hypothetical protein n=1 Tax=Clostridium thermarum TaxID=1716543 RepID=UPI001FAA15B5|nr:hypothetical protein [Clostridium thermarum]